MLRGEKPLAMFSEALVARDILPEADFEPHVVAGHIIKREYKGSDSETGIPFISIYYALPHEAWRIDAMRSIEAARLFGQHPVTDKEERDIGRLLGYTDIDIARFIDWKRSGR